MTTDEIKFFNLPQAEQMRLLGITKEILNSHKYKGLETPTIIQEMWAKKRKQSN